MATLRHRGHLIDEDHGLGHVGPPSGEPVICPDGCGGLCASDELPGLLRSML